MVIKKRYYGNTPCARCVFFKNENCHVLSNPKYECWDKDGKNNIIFTTKHVGKHEKR